MLAPVDLVMIYVLEPGAGVLTSSLSPVFKLGFGGIQVDFVLVHDSKNLSIVGWNAVVVVHFASSGERSLRAS